MSLSLIAGGASGRVALLLLSPLILDRSSSTCLRRRRQPEGKSAEDELIDRGGGSGLLGRNKAMRHVVTRAKAMSAHAYIAAIFVVYTMDG